MIWTGFLIGLLGSWHCIGMCGPIALMIPGSKGKNRFAAIGLYHFGKILSYLTLGSVFGMIPALINSFTVQATITISVGVLMLLLALVPVLMNKLERSGFTLFNRYFNLKNKLAQSLNKNKTEYSFYIGFLNGFVPCGMVYLAALGAMSQPHFSDSLLFMLLFGLGTVPLMSIFLFAAGYFKSRFQKNALKLRTTAFVLVGCFMIWKGTVHINDSIIAPKEGEVFNACAQLYPLH
ncbi:MAG: sulfite exporter TauE/SafE family protein [Bacteroidetes bacterium]|nr:sulfite exporter TauE/SafE family protein [Bacteroidota bacterium]